MAKYSAKRSWEATFQLANRNYLMMSKRMKGECLPVLKPCGGGAPSGHLAGRQMEAGRRPAPPRLRHAQPLRTPLARSPVHSTENSEEPKFLKRQKTLSPEGFTENRAATSLLLDCRSMKDMRARHASWARGFGRDGGVYSFLTGC